MIGVVYRMGLFAMLVVALASCGYYHHEPSPFDHAVNRVIANQPMQTDNAEAPVRKPRYLSASGLVMR